MKTGNAKRVSWITALLVCSAVAISGSALGQTSAHKRAASSKMMMGEQDMMKHCQAMAGQHEKLMADMDAMDAELNKGVAAMNAATGAAKVEAVAAVINQLASQRKTMRSNMAQMQSGKMQHMMEHMRSGNMQAMQKSMAMCPMMKGMDHMK